MKDIINLPLWVKIFIAFALGIILAYYELSFLACIFTGFILLSYLLSCKFSHYLLIPALILLTGSIYFDFNKAIFPPSLPAEVNNFEIKGKVVSYPRYDDRKCSFILKTERKEPFLQKMQVFLYFPARVERGDEIFIKGKLVLPDEPGNPGEFNYAAFLKKEKICYMLITGEEKNLQVVKKACLIDFLLNKCRQKAEITIKNILPDKKAGILLGMLLGKKEEISPEDYREFQKSGIVHIFAVSGLHVGFLAALVGFILSLFKASPWSKITVTCAVLLVYGSIVGWPVSVMRAVIMTILAAAAFYFKRENGLINSLGLAGVIILLLDPYALFKIGFQLSFAATFGLVYIYPALRKVIKEKKWWIDLMLIPLCAQVAVLPFIAYYFYLFTPGALITNILTSYLAGGAIILGFLGIITGIVFPFLSPVFIYPAGFMIDIITAVVKIATSLPFAYLWVKKPDVGFIILYYAGILLVCYALYHKTIKAAGTGILMITVFLFFLCLPPSFYDRGYLEITFIDVGQGDSILIKTPEGKFILVDGGGNRWTDVEERKLLPYLHSRGINRFYMLVNSHPDYDHLKGLERVLEEHKNKFLCIPASLAGVSEYQYIKSAAFNKGSKVVYLYAGQKIKLSKDCFMEVLYPEKEYRGEKYNDNSLVLYMKYRDFAVLLTGDIEQEGIKNLLNKGYVKEAKVVKVPHHGSRGSLYPEFYDKVNPHLAVISVGKNNFGHPHPEVLDLLGAKGIRVLRTDQNGAITFLSNGSEIRIKTFKP
ncbi:competence protein ComEC [Thermosyntropha lipolytica DSM 11003]|uniref:Competence protein ComEC n=1 Tax=Thermosyntropha lipolytica DSM 11003 TaxID=1123382 RepID=A0A1M5N6E8_9FIRM|nr:DNA internalization-related competence protein ComEC/Rec2 [Thermosyntropha lipolytica]SHG85002.1 competence protein ComEC [Thermosyntropha lipolytica DSM 11003]